MHAGLAKVIIRLLARSERNIWNTLGLLMKNKTVSHMVDEKWFAITVVYDFIADAKNNKI